MYKRQLKDDKAVLSVWKSAAVSNGETINSGVEAIMAKALCATQAFNKLSLIHI